MNHLAKAEQPASDAVDGGRGAVSNHVNGHMEIVVEMEQPLGLTMSTSWMQWSNER